MEVDTPAAGTLGSKQLATPTQSEPKGHFWVQATAPGLPRQMTFLENLVKAYGVHFRSEYKKGNRALPRLGEVHYLSHDFRLKLLADPVDKSAALKDWISNVDSITHGVAPAATVVKFVVADRPRKSYILNLGRLQFDGSIKDFLTDEAECLEDLGLPAITLANFAPEETFDDQRGRQLRFFPSEALLAYAKKWAKSHGSSFSHAVGFSCGPVPFYPDMPPKPVLPKSAAPPRDNPNLIPIKNRLGKRSSSSSRPQQPSEKPSSSVASGHNKNSSSSSAQKKKKKKSNNPQKTRIFRGRSERVTELLNGNEDLGSRKTRHWAKILRDNGLVSPGEDSSYESGPNIHLAPEFLKNRRLLASGLLHVEDGKIVPNPKRYHALEKVDARRVIVPDNVASSTDSDGSPMDTDQAGSECPNKKATAPSSASLPPRTAPVQESSTTWNEFLCNLGVMIRDADGLKPGPRFASKAEYEVSWSDIRRQRFKITANGELEVDPAGKGHHHTGPVTHEEERDILARVADLDSPLAHVRLFHLTLLLKHEPPSPVDQFEFDILEKYTNSST